MSAPPPPDHLDCFVATAAGAPPRRERRAAPALLGDELLVAVEACVIGAAELATLATRPGRVPGGAAVGRVVAAGPAAADHLGRRVLVGPLAACGECDACRRGRLAACPGARRLGVDADGALATHVVARRRWVCPLDGALAAAPAGPEAALLAREAPLAYALACRAGLAPGDASVWLGDGPVAALGAALARALGALAARPAAPAADTPAAWADAVRAAWPGEPGQVPPTAAWRVFLCDPGPSSRATSGALALADLGATRGLAAPAAAALPPGTHAVLARALALDAVWFGVDAAHPDLVPEVVALAARGELALAPHAQVFAAAALEGALAAAARADGRAVIVTLPAV